MLIVLLALLGLTVLGAFLILFYDVSPPDDQDLLPQWTAPELEPNPLASFASQLRARHGRPLPPSLFEPGATFTVDQAKSASRSLNDNKHVLEAYDALMKTDPRSWRWVGPTRLAVPLTPPCLHASEAALAAQLAIMRLRLPTGNPDATDITAEVLKLLAFAQGLEGAEGQTAHHLVANHIRQQALDQLKHLAASPGFTPASLQRLLNELPGLEPIPSHVQFALRTEYAFLKQFIAEKLRQPQSVSHLSNNNPGYFPERQLKPNMTATMHAAHLRPVIVSLESGWQQAAAAVQAPEAGRPPVAPGTGMKAALNPNATGIVLLNQTLPVADQLVVSKIELTARHRCAILLLALRLYELRHDHLPDELGALVPDCVPVISQNPYDGLPLKWNAATRWIDPAGPSLQDDGGKLPSSKSS